DGVRAPGARCRVHDRVRAGPPRLPRVTRSRAGPGGGTEGIRHRDGKQPRAPAPRIPRVVRGLPRAPGGGGLGVLPRPRPRLSRPLLLGDGQGPRARLASRSAAVSEPPSDSARVAVIIPCFDEGEPLRDAAASVLGESCVAERIVVDDGSTNELTLAILGELEQQGFRVIHQANKGPSPALMAGVAATSAPFVFRLDSDDLLEPGALDALAAALEAHPDAAAAWGDLQTFGLM